MSKPKHDPKDDHWQKCISNTGTVRGVAVHCSTLVRDLCRSHGLVGESARSLGEAIVAGYLLASYAKEGERMNLNIKGNGWAKQALVDAYPDGTCRGYVVPNEGLGTPVVDLTGEGPWGQGLLSVLRKREMDARSEPYVGTVPLLTGHLAKDLTFYLLQSEQIPSAVGIAINLDEGGEVATAGGFLVQTLPGATDAEIAEIEDHVTHMSDFAAELSAGIDTVTLLSRIFQERPFLLLEKKELRFNCTCSWERVRRALTLIGVGELQAMIDEVGEAVVKCDFCTKEYRADGDELRKMIEESKG